MSNRVLVDPDSLMAIHIYDGEEVVVGDIDGQAWVGTFSDHLAADRFIKMSQHHGSAILGLRNELRREERAAPSSPRDGLQNTEQLIAAASQSPAAHQVAGAELILQALIAAERDLSTAKRETHGVAPDALASSLPLLRAVILLLKPERVPFPLIDEEILKDARRYRFLRKNVSGKIDIHFKLPEMTGDDRAEYHEAPFDEFVDECLKVEHTHNSDQMTFIPGCAACAFELIEGRWKAQPAAEKCVDCRASGEYCPEEHR